MFERVVACAGPGVRVVIAQAEDIESIFEGKLAGTKGLIREGMEFLKRLKANEKRETTASEGGLGCAMVFAVCAVLAMVHLLAGVEKALEELLGDKAKPTELAHIDVRARLQLAELIHFLDLP